MDDNLVWQATFESRAVTADQCRDGPSTRGTFPELRVGSVPASSSFSTTQTIRKMNISVESIVMFGVYTNWPPIILERTISDLAKIRYKGLYFRESHQPTLEAEIDRWRGIPVL